MNRSESEQCRWHAVSDERALQRVAIETILARPPQRLFDDWVPMDGRANYLRFWISSNTAVDLAARVSTRRSNLRYRKIDPPAICG
jgi:hypothetical protein